MKTIGIVGTRSRDSGDDMQEVIKAWLAVHEDGDELVSGGCPQGGDRFAEYIAERYQIPIKIYYAQWCKFGKSAGFQRNGLIARDADILIACVAKARTGGTEDTIKKFELMIKAGKNGKVVLV